MLIGLDTNIFIELWKKDSELKILNCGKKYKFLLSQHVLCELHQSNYVDARTKFERIYSLLLSGDILICHDLESLIGKEILKTEIPLKKEDEFISFFKNYIFNISDENSYANFREYVSKFLDNDMFDSGKAFNRHLETHKTDRKKMIQNIEDIFEFNDAKSLIELSRWFLECLSCRFVKSSYERDLFLKKVIENPKEYPVLVTMASSMFITALSDALKQYQFKNERLKKVLKSEKNNHTDTVIYSCCYGSDYFVSGDKRLNNFIHSIRNILKSVEISLPNEMTFLQLENEMS